MARDHVRNAADVRLHLGEPHWWAFAQSESGWIFAIGSDGDHTFYAEGAAEPEAGPPGPPWSDTETPNWSGDIYW